jgi:hypothetical protein
MNRAIIWLLWSIGIAFILILSMIIIKNMLSAGSDLFITKLQIQDNLNKLSQEGNKACIKKNLEFQGVYMTDINKGYALCLMKSPCKIISEGVSIEEK